MEAILLREPNLIFEAAAILWAGRSNQSCRELKNSILKKYAIDENVLDSCFDAIIEASEYVCDGVKEQTDEKLLNFLFGRHSSMKYPFAFYLIHDLCRRRKIDFKADIAELRRMPTASFFINFSSLLLAEFAPANFRGRISNFSELFAFIETMPIPDDEKWALMKLYNHFNDYKEKLADILALAGELYMKKYDTIKHYIGWFIAAVAEPLNNDGIRFIEQNYGIEPSASADAIFLRPSVAMCNTIHRLLSYTSEKPSDFLYVGVLFEPLREITDVSTVDDKICRTLRTLGDNRKYEILKLLAESPRYGQQIAAIIDISTATVSHHMSMLMEAGFVDIKRESNRIYYIPNKKKIRDFLDELSEALLG